MSDTKILVVEDDRNLLDTLAYNLRRENYEVITSMNGADALAIARQANPDLMILDVMLPGMSGLEVCRILRKDMTVPIIMLTARNEEMDKIIGLEIGADDYMTKPFSMRELMARVRATLRRVEMSSADYSKSGTAINVGNIKIDEERHLALLDGIELELTPKEYELLVFLAKNIGFVFNREQLLEKVWGYEYAGDTRTVDVHIRWLRQKIERNASKPEKIITVRGAGYKLVD